MLVHACVQCPAFDDPDICQCCMEMIDSCLKTDDEGKLQVSIRRYSLVMFRHFCCRMYRLATMHSVTDRQTNRRQYDANSRSYCVQQYDWLKISQ